MGFLRDLFDREPRRRTLRRGDPYRNDGRVVVPPAGALASRPPDPPEPPRGGGLGYAHYLIPRENDVRPTAAQAARLVQAWLDGGYLAKPGSPAQKRLRYTSSHWAEVGATTGAVLLRNRISFIPMDLPIPTATIGTLETGDYRMLFPIDTAWTAGLKVPVTSLPTARRGGEGPAYNLEIHSLADYVHLTSEIIAPFPTDDPVAGTVPCRVSSTNLRYSAERIENMFDQIGSRVRLICPTCATRFRPQERTSQVRDGWSGERAPVMGGATYRFAIQIDFDTAVPEVSPRATPEFKALCEQALGVKLYEVGNAY